MATQSSIFHFKETFLRLHSYFQEDYKCTSHVFILFILPRGLCSLFASNKFFFKSFLVLIYFKTNQTRGAKTQASSPNSLAQCHHSTVFVIELWSPSRALTTSVKKQSLMCQSRALSPRSAPPTLYTGLASPYQADTLHHIN